MKILMHDLRDVDNGTSAVCVCVYRVVRCEYSMNCKQMYYWYRRYVHTYMY